MRKLVFFRVGWLLGIRLISVCAIVRCSVLVWLVMLLLDSVVMMLNWLFFFRVMNGLWMSCWCILFGK